MMIISICIMFIIISYYSCCFCLYYLFYMIITIDKSCKMQQSQERGEMLFPCFYLYSLYEQFLFIFSKIDIPYRWRWTTIVRGKHSEESWKRHKILLKGGATVAPTVLTRPMCPQIYTSTSLPTLGKKHMPAHTVRTGQIPRIM